METIPNSEKSHASLVTISNYRRAFCSGYTCLSHEGGIQDLKGEGVLLNGFK